MNQVAAKSAVPNEVSALLVPFHGQPFVVPNLAVAEIVPYEDPVPVPGKPSWYLGEMPWRGQRIPLVSIPGMRNEEYEIPSEARIAVFNGVGGELPFYGVLCHGIPRLARVRPQDLEAIDGMYTPIDDAFVSVNGELAIIPNLLQIEMLIASA